MSEKKPSILSTINYDTSRKSLQKTLEEQQVAREKAEAFEREWRSKSAIFLKKYTKRRSYEEFADYDYLKKLSDSDKEWLGQFTKEYYRSDLKDPALHKAEKKRELFSANDARRRDIFCKNNRTKLPSYLADDTADADSLSRFAEALRNPMSGVSPGAFDIEDALIDAIDADTRAANRRKRKK